MLLPFTKCFLVSTSRPFHHSCFHDWKKVLLLFVKICLLAGTGPIINAFTSGRRRLHYSQKNACCAPVSPLTFSRVGESASTTRVVAKNCFQRAPNYSGGRGCPRQAIGGICPKCRRQVSKKYNFVFLECRAAQTRRE